MTLTGLLYYTSQDYYTSNYHSKNIDSVKKVHIVGAHGSSWRREELFEALAGYMAIQALYLTFWFLYGKDAMAYYIPEI